MTIALACFLVVLVGALHWLMPSLTPPTVPFGVRIPAGRGDEQVIVDQRRRFRIVTAALTGATLVVVVATAGHPVVLVVAVMVQAAAGTALYLRARAAISAAKAREDWFAGLRQVTVADTGLRTAPEPFAWPWLIAPVLVLVATVVAGIVAYPSMPGRLATHFGADGTPDRFATRSVGSAFGPVAVQAFATLLMCGLAYLVLRLRARLDAEDPDASARHRRFVSVTSRALLFLAACVNATFLIAALQTWDLYRPHGAAALVAVAPALLGILVVVAATVRTGQEGSRLAIAGTRTAPAAPAGVVNRDDDRLYRWGLFYFNPDDPAVFAPKRFGVGWTVNLASRATWALVLGGVVVLAGLAWLSALLGG